MSNSHSRRNRALRQDDAQQAAALATLEGFGFHVEKFSDFHYRIDYYVDFWPITTRYRQINGAFGGTGIAGLIDHLKADRSPKVALEPAKDWEAYAHELEAKLAKIKGELT